MSDEDSEELRLIEAADGIELTQIDLMEMTQLLEDWLSTLTLELGDERLPRPSSLHDAHPAVHPIEEFNELLTTSADDWKLKWASLEPAKLLAQAFDDRVMLLVFGKFNAGKSSLCNLIAERFVAHGRAVKYFHLEAGHVVRTTQPLQEGATETTARLQGVSLGHSLVLLDTPGLHSVTPENAALTQRFTDSADAVLWLTSSTSPGQVQELNEMARELHRCKPLLPVITRSDILEEDELDGEIVKLLRNKTLANRQLQEEDVQSRARSKLEQMGVPHGVLRSPVSISAHATREQGQTPQALFDGGFTRLYSAVLDLVEPARAYKQRKSVEVLLHHLEENVLGAVKSDIQPMLRRLVGSLSQERERLKMLQPRLTRLVWRQVASALPGMLERHAHKHGSDITGLCLELEALLREALAREAASSIGEYDCHMPDSGTDHWIGIAQEPGCRASFDSAAADAGGVFSSGPESVSIGFEQLHDVLQKSLDQRLVEQVGSLFGACVRALDEIEQSASGLQDMLARQDSAFMEVKHQLRDVGRVTDAVGERVVPAVSLSAHR